MNDSDVCRGYCRGQLPHTTPSPFNLLHSPLVIFLREQMEERVFSFIGDMDDEDEENSDVRGMKISKIRMSPQLYYDVNGV